MQAFVSRSWKLPEQKSAVPGNSRQIIPMAKTAQAARARAFPRAGGHLFMYSCVLPEHPAGAQGPELPGHGQAQVIVIIQIGLLLLPLDALALLELFPSLTGFVTARLIVGASALTGKHRNTPLAR